MNATITINKAKLREKLEARIIELTDEFNNSPVTMTMNDALEAFRKGETPEQFAERMADWHVQVADGLRNGTITLTKSNALSGAPEKPRPLGTEKTPRRLYYYQRQDVEYYLNYYTQELLEREITSQAHNFEKSLRPLTTAMEMLDMSDDESVTINTADYHSLLSANNRVY